MAFILGFLIAGLILVLGFLGDYLFKRTRIPDILILIFLGFLLSSVFKIVNPTDIAPATQIFASLALLIILFDGGLNINFFKALHESPRALLLASVGTLISMGLVTTFTHFVLGWGITEGLLLGAILGGTSSAIVIPIVSRIKNLNKKISTILSLESVFTDALVVVIAITLLQFFAHVPTDNGLSMIARGIATQFSIGLVVGAILGIVWLRILKMLRGNTYDDVLTLATVLVMYSVVEMLGGNGAIFALSFGLVLGNGFIISRMLRIKNPVEATGMMKKFQSQISFLIRTFFFVYLGIIISFNNPTIMLYGVGIALLLFIGRYLSVYLSSIKCDVLRYNRKIMTFMLPRGLAAAVVAQIAVSSGIPHADVLMDIVITVIVTTVLISSMGSFFIFRRPGEKPSGTEVPNGRKAEKVKEE